MEPLSTTWKPPETAFIEARKPFGRRLALAVGAVLVASGCGFSAPIQDPPEDPVEYEEVLGLWENGHGETIEFREDGTFTADPSSFSARVRSSSQEGTIEGTWWLCETIFATMEDGSKQRSPTCAESRQGEYIETESERGGLGGSLLFTEDEELELYPYALEDATLSSDYYTKVD